VERRHAGGQRAAAPVTRICAGTEKVSVGRLLGFILRRAVTALLLILVAASAALLLARLAPGDHLSGFGLDPAVVAAERHRLGLDRPLVVQYFDWVGRLLRFDLGESTAHPGRDISALIAGRAQNSALIGVAALLLATVIGIPLGIITGSRPRSLAATVVRGASVTAFSVPPIVLSLVLLFVAARTGWFPVGGLPDAATMREASRYFVLPVLALALPIAAALERLQSRSMIDALRDPSIVAARARGIPRRRLVWRHAFRLSLKPVLAVYGVMIGALISGSFIVEYVMSWPGLGRLLYDALIARDANLVAACAATGAAFLATGIVAADVALAATDPRIEANQ
jgi:peptide/nickel transport system permease protein